jgi:hypothetical protein
MRPLSPLRTFSVLVRHEFAGGFKGPLFWIALACLFVLPLPVRMAYGGEIMILGRTVGESYRLAVALVGGFSVLMFFSTLYTLCLCLERTGSHYLRSNDLLILARATGRFPFYAAKLASVFLNAFLYGALGLIGLWEELSRIGASGATRLFPLLLPLGMNLACLIAVYFFLRNFFRNFLIFFLWLIALPVLFLAGLWHCYADPLKGGLRVFLWLPQLGGLHAWALGAVHPALDRPEADWALLNVGLWTAVAFTAGALIFLRKRL